MRSSRQPRSAHDAGHAPGPGGIVRSARVAQGLSLAAFGARVGYSAAQVSRYERGITPLTDITVLRRFAAALALPQQLFGLNPDGAKNTARHAAISAKDGPPGVRGNTVDHECQWEDGDDPVRRRELLAGAAALAGATALARGTAGRTGAPPGSAAGLEDVLYGRTEAAPVPLAELRASTTAARDDFRAARYDRLPSALPRLIAAAQATSDNAGSVEHAEARTLLADAYILAADFAVKINDDPLAWMTADRALQAAQAGNDPLTLADARRAVATAMRRTGHPDRACSLLVRACRDIDAGRHGRRRTRHVRHAAQRRRLHCRHRREPPRGGRIHRRSRRSRQPGSVPAPPGASPLSGQPGLPSTRSASRKSSATTGPPSSTPRNYGPPASRPPNARAATGSMSPAPTTSGESPKPATPRWSPPSAPPPLKSATARPSTA